MIVSGMTIAAQHFQGQLIVVLCSSSSAAAIVHPPRLALSGDGSCQPKIRTLQGAKGQLAAWRSLRGCEL